MIFLRKENTVTHGFANFIILTFKGVDTVSSNADDLIVNQYKDKKS